MSSRVLFAADCFLLLAGRDDYPPPVEYFFAEIMESNLIFFFFMVLRPDFEVIRIAVEDEVFSSLSGDFIGISTDDLNASSFLFFY
jgi:hypothetical protein